MTLTMAILCSVAFVVVVELTDRYFDHKRQRALCKANHPANGKYGMGDVLKWKSDFAPDMMVKIVWGPDCNGNYAAVGYYHGELMFINPERWSKSYGAPTVTATTHSRWLLSWRTHVH